MDFFRFVGGWVVGRNRSNEFLIRGTIGLIQATRAEAMKATTGEVSVQVQFNPNNTHSFANWIRTRRRFNRDLCFNNAIFENIFHAKERFGIKGGVRALKIT